MIFKNSYSEKAFFTFRGEKKQCINGLYKTEDKAEIEFLKKNPNFTEYKGEEKVIDNKVGLVKEEDVEKIVDESKKNDSLSATDEMIKITKGGA